MAVIRLKDSNDYDAKELLDSRETYKKELFNFIKQKNQASLYEHFIENQYYGKIDENNNSIFPSERFFSGLPETINNFLFAQDFVVDAFNDMASYYSRAYTLQRNKTTGSPFNKIYPFSAFVSMHKNYTNHLSKYNFAIIDYIKQTNSEKQIKSFKDFVKYFMFFLKQYPGLLIVTRSKFIKSKFNPPMSTGLSIELASDSFDDDLKKFNTYVRDQNFPFLVECCRRYSFLLDKDAPWRIHFDFNSPQALTYMSRYNLKSKKEFFDKRYYKAFYTDIKIIKDFLMHVYKTYTQNDNILTFVVDVNSCNSPILETIEMPNINQRQMETDFDEMFWLKYYFDIRILEDKINLSDGTYKKILVDTENIFKYGRLVNDTSRYNAALNYLNTIINANTSFVSVNDSIKF